MLLVCQQDDVSVFPAASLNGSSELPSLRDAARTRQGAGGAAESEWRAGPSAVGLAAAGPKEGESWANSAAQVRERQSRLSLRFCCHSAKLNALMPFLALMLPCCQRLVPFLLLLLPFCQRSNTGAIRCGAAAQATANP